MDEVWAPKSHSRHLESSKMSRVFKVCHPSHLPTGRSVQGRTHLQQLVQNCRPHWHFQGKDLVEFPGFSQWTKDSRLLEKERACSTQTCLRQTQESERKPFHSSHRKKKKQNNNGQRDSSRARIAFPCRSPANGLQGENHAPELPNCIETVVESCRDGQIVYM